MTVFDYLAGVFTSTLALVAGQVPGTTTNNNATTGNVGEYIASIVAGGTAFPLNNNYSNAASIALTPGDWDISCILTATNNGATVTAFRAGISTDSTANSFSDEVDADNSARGGNFQSADLTVTVASYRKSLSVSTSIYLKARATYSAGTPNIDGARISARRVR